MASYTQANRLLAAETPLGKDALLLIRFQGHEAISELFAFELDLLAPRETGVPFDKLIGQSVTVKLALPAGETRCFNGIFQRFTQGKRDDVFAAFRATMVPRLWLWTRKVQSRIFQHLSIPEILKHVLAGLNVSFEIRRAFPPRDYVVQYRESDFAFASRLMEEEGMYYYFKHADGGHTLVVTDQPSQHPDLPAPNKITYEEVGGGARDEMRVTVWEKTQELRSGQYTLWDHCFELPGRNLEARQSILESVPVGKVTHKLKVGGNEQLEIYDYPGGYAQRFDGIDKAGAPQPEELQQVFEDNQRTTKIRMEQEAVPSLRIEGASTCGHFVPGHLFTLTRHFDADGPYLLTRVEHRAELVGDYRSGGEVSLGYRNRFASIPAGLPYRPPRVTPRPTIQGTQTATVVGPPGEEIFTDRYGRVKVQFHWDRQGKKDANSSCWLRVAQVWAGKGWGAFFWPRVGHEVVVAFEEGDPDQPLVIGSVYNAENMPPLPLPQGNLFNGFKSSTLRGNAHENFNGIVMVDVKGKEHLAIHSERHLVFNAEYDKVFRTGRHSGERVPGARVTTVGDLPLGGGSGGGGPNANLWPKPEPQAVLGLNSIVVYGGNFQIAVPLNCQMAIGSNLQICVNPLAWATILPNASPPPGTAALAQILGSGLGGNMQLTLGHSANVVFGQEFDINLGPKKIDYEAGHKLGTFSIVISSVIVGVTIAFVVAYGCLHDDDERAILLMTFQFVMQILLMVLMDLHKLYYDSDDEIKKHYNELFKADQTTVPDSLESWTEGLAMLGIMVIPILLECIGEGKLDAPGPAPTI